MQVSFAAALVAASVALAAGTSHGVGPCGAEWACPDTESKVCGTKAGAEKTYKNVCEAYCSGATVTKRTPCVKDQLALFNFCKTLENQQTKCNAAKGCSYQIEEQFGSGAVEDFYNNALETQGCAVDGGTDEDKCNGLKNDDGSRKCMFVKYGDEGSCSQYEACQASQASEQNCKGVKGKDGKAGCDWFSSGNCEIEGTHYGEYPTNEEKCKGVGKWVTYTTCSPKMESGAGGMYGEGEGGEGSPTGESKECYSQYKKEDCENLKDDKGNKKCDVVTMEMNGFCEAKDEGNYDYGCFNFTKADECNQDAQCEFKEPESSSDSFSCETKNPCKGITKEQSCTGKCKWLKPELEDGKAECFFDEFGVTTEEDGYGAGGAGGEGDQCQKIKEKSNCLAKKNADGDAACTFSGTSGVCGIKGSSDEFSLCQCDGDGCPENYDSEADACNKAKDIGGDACAWDTKRAFSMCLAKNCYNILNKAECNGFSGCEYVTSGEEGFCQDKGTGGGFGDTGVDSGDSAGGTSCYDFMDQDGPTDKCSAENKCVKISNSQSVCAPASADAADEVWTTCSQYSDSKSECEAKKCKYSVVTSQSCTDAGSCEVGQSSKEKCEAIKDDKGEAKCSYSAKVEATENTPEIEAFCNEKEFSFAGGDGAGNEGSLEQNGTCSYDSTREFASYGDSDTEFFASGSGAFGSGGQAFDQGACGKHNASQVAGRKDCDKQRDIDGLKLCDVVNQTVLPGRCNYAPAGATTTAEPAANGGDNSYGDNYGAYAGGEDTCGRLNDAASCQADGNCIAHLTQCVCENVDKLPVKESTDYGGYGGYGGAAGGSYGGNYGGYGNDGGLSGPEPDIPQTAYQCAAAPTEAKCAMKEMGSCIPRNNTGLSNEEMEEKCYSKSSKTQCTHNKCMWQVNVQCQSKDAYCNDLSTDKECGATDGAAHSCKWNKPQIAYSCEKRMISKADQCAKYTDHDGCAAEDGCAFQKDVEDFYGEVGGEVGFSSGDGASLFVDCFQLDSAQKCEKATQADAMAPCQTDTASKKPKTAEVCAKVSNALCGSTEGCMVAQVKKCAWALNTYDVCVGKESANDEACSAAGPTTCELDAKCEKKEMKDADCIPFDACSLLGKEGEDKCQAKKGCKYEGEQGACSPKGGSAENGTDTPSTGSGMSDCFSIQGKTQCADNKDCSWMTMDGGMNSARCYFDIMSMQQGSGDETGDMENLASGDGEMMNEYGVCYAHSNKTACENKKVDRCRTNKDSPKLAKCNDGKDKESCEKLKCTWAAEDKCKWYEPKQDDSCQPAKEDDFDSNCWDHSDMKKCKADTACKVYSNQYPGSCSPNQAEDNFEAGSGKVGSGADGMDDGSGADGADQGLSPEQCAMFPEQCCMNQYKEEDCAKQKDPNGDQLCKFSKSSQQGYCGGEFCNYNETLGLDEAACDKKDKCSWVTSGLGQAQCTYYNKCHGLNATSCKAFDKKGCEYLGGDEDGDNFNANNNGYCDAKEEPKDGEMSDCMGIMEKETCNKNDKCTYKEMEGGGGDDNMYESGYCGTPMNTGDDSSTDFCDDSIGDRAYNKTTCSAAKGCKWFSAEDSTGMGNNEGGDDMTTVSNCLAVPMGFGFGGGDSKDGSDPDSVTPGFGSGSGFGDVCTGENAMCQCHDTKTECGNKLDDEGEPKCAWKTFDEVEGASAQCMRYNKCDQPDKAKCQAKGCSYVEQLDVQKGGIVGRCQTPPSKFEPEDGANYTCIPFVAVDNTDNNYGSGYYGTDATTSSTTTTTPAPTTQPPSTAEPTTTTVTTVTTVTTKENEIHGKDGDAVGIDDMKVTTEAGQTAAPINYYNANDRAVDVEFDDNRYDTLSVTAEQELNLKVAQLVTSRLVKLGVSKVAFRSAVAFAEGKNDQSARNRGHLSVRVSFKQGAITVEEIIALVRDLKGNPLSDIDLFGRRELYTATDTVEVKKSDHPLWFPVEIVKTTSTPEPDVIDDATGNVMTESQKVQAEEELKKKLEEAQARLDALAGNNLDEAAQADLAAKESQLKEKKAELVKCQLSNGACDDTKISQLKADIQQYEADKSGLLNDGTETEAPEQTADKGEDYTPVIVAVVVVVVFAAIAAMVVVFVCKHRMYDEVYGSAGRGIYGGGVYGNPVYAAQPGTVPPQGFMSTAAATDYKAQYQAPANTAAPKKGGGLVRQESMC